MEGVYIQELLQDDRPDIPKFNDNITSGPLITKSEVRLAIRNSKRGKSSGPGEITTEMMIAALEEFGVDTLTYPFNDIYNTEFFPEDFLTSIFITVPKKPRATECSDFRTISLMSHTVKILLKIFLESMKCKINEEVGEEQFGFRKGTGTTEGIFCMNILAQKPIETQKDIYVCFIDYSKAFDRVHHRHLINCLNKIKINDKEKTPD